MNLAQALLRSLHRVEEEVRPYLTRAERLYVFADLPRAAYRVIMWSVPKAPSLNGFGIERLLQCGSGLPQ